MLLIYFNSPCHSKSCHRLYSHISEDCILVVVREIGRHQADHSYKGKQVPKSESKTGTLYISVTLSHTNLSRTKPYNQEILHQRSETEAEDFLDFLLFANAGEEHTRKARAFVKEKLAKAQSVCVPAEHHDDFEKVSLFRLTTSPLAFKTDAMFSYGILGDLGTTRETFF